MFIITGQLKLKQYAPYLGGHDVLPLPRSTFWGVSPLSPAGFTPLTQPNLVGALHYCNYCILNIDLARCMAQPTTDFLLDVCESS